MDRSYAFLGERGISVGMDVKNDNGKQIVKFAIAFCNKKAGDDFNRKIARTIIDDRLNADEDKFTYSTEYDGEKPRTFLFVPLIRQLRAMGKIVGVIHTDNGSIKGNIKEYAPTMTMDVSNSNCHMSMDCKEINWLTVQRVDRNVNNILKVFPTLIPEAVKVTNEQ